MLPLPYLSHHVSAHSLLTHVIFHAIHQTFLRPTWILLILSWWGRTPVRRIWILWDGSNVSNWTNSSKLPKHGLKNLNCSYTYVVVCTYKTSFINIKKIFQKTARRVEKSNKVVISIPHWYNITISLANISLFYDLNSILCVRAWPRSGQGH